MNPAVLHIISCLDRANVAFAKLRMAEALGFSAAVFGFGIGVFFIGYLILETPGQRFGTQMTWLCVTGRLRTNGHNELQCLHFLSACFITGGLLLPFLRIKPKTALIFDAH